MDAMPIHRVVEQLAAFLCPSPVSRSLSRCYLPLSRPARSLLFPLPVRRHRKSRDERLRERDVADVDDDESARPG